MPGNEPHQRDAALAAWERAMQIHNPDAEAWQRTLDQDHYEIYQHAAHRLETIYADKEHYVRSKPGRATGHKTKQRKKNLSEQRKQPWYQCHTCHTRVHQGLTAAAIEARLQEDCEQLTNPALEPDLRPDKEASRIEDTAGPSHNGRCPCFSGDHRVPQVHQMQPGSAQTGQRGGVQQLPQQHLH